MNDQLINQAIQGAGDSASQYAGTLQGQRYQGVGLQGGPGAVKASGGGFSPANLAKSVGNAATAAGKFVYHSAVDAPSALGGYLSGAEHAGYQNTSLKSASDNALKAQVDLTKAYQLGRISRAQYSQGLRDLTKQQLDVSQQAKDVAQSIGTLGQRAKAGISSAAEVATVAAPGLTSLTALEEAGGAAGKVAGVANDVIGSGKGNVASKLVRNALITQPTAQIPGQIVGDVQTKNYKDIALQGALLAGIPLVGKFASPAISEAVSGLKTRVFGEAGGPIASFFGNAAVKNASPETQQLLKQAEEFTYNQGAKNPNEFFKNYLLNTFHLPQNATPEEFASAFQQYAKPAQKLQALREAGKAPANAVLTADYRQALPQANKVIQAAGEAAFASSENKMQLADKVIGELHVSNPRIENELRSVIRNANDGPQAQSFIENIVQKNIQKVPGFTPPKGFAVTFGPGKLAAIPDATAAADLRFGTSPGKVAGKLGSALTKSGLSPIASDTSITGAVKQNLQDQLGPDGTRIMNALQDNLHASVGAYDPRLLSKTEIHNALARTGIVADAGTVRQALDTAYSKLSLEQRGLGPKLVDTLIQKVPGMREYLRVQSAGKFGLNPFFATKVAIKSGLLASGEADSVALLGRQTEAADTFVSKVMGGRVLGEGANDFLGTSTTLKPGLVGRFQQKLAANMVDKIAANNGTTVSQALEDNGPLAKELQHAVETVVGYPKGGYLDSNLAKTLNIAVFPSRFETKIATAGVKYLAKQPPVTRAVLINHLLDARTWANSPQGKQWVQKNSELVDAMNYFTPTHTLNQFMEFLGNGHHLGDLGQVGGLPLGVITQIINNQGVNLGALDQSEGVRTKTGQPYAKKLPVTPTARLQQAGTDFVSTLFGWPGATLGLQPKNDLIQKNVPGLKPVKGGFKTTDGGSTGGASISSSALQLPQRGISIPRAQKLSTPTRAAALASKTSGSTRQKSLKVLPRNLQLPRPPKSPS